MRESLDALLAAVCAAPRDEAPRQVYADALIEAGDPVGEWIALELAKARGELDRDAEARHRELVRTLDIAARSHGVSRGGYVTFTRGFPFALHVWGNVASVVDLPAFATLERLDALDEIGDATVLAVLDHPNAANVRVVSSVRCTLIERACAVPREWTTLYVHGDDAEPLPAPTVYENLPKLAALAVILEGWRPIARDAVAIAGLRQLVFRSSSDPRIETLDLPASLETLELRLEGDGIDHLALPPSVRSLEIAGPLPRMTVAAPIAFVDLSSAASVSQQQLAAFAGTRELWLSREHTDAGTFAALTSLEALRLWHAPIARDALRGLTNLRSLVMYERLERRVELAGLPLEKLDYFGPLEWISNLPSLRELRVVYPEAPGQVAALIARFPSLAHLELDGSRVGARHVHPAHVAGWLPALAASAIRSFTLTYEESHRRCAIELVRDRDGRLEIASSEPGALANAIGRLI